MITTTDLENGLNGTGRKSSSAGADEKSGETEKLPAKLIEPSYAGSFTVTIDYGEKASGSTLPAPPVGPGPRGKPEFKITITQNSVHITVLHTYGSDAQQISQ